MFSKANLMNFEAILLSELKDSLDELSTLQLLELPTLITHMDEDFSQKLEQVQVYTFITSFHNNICNLHILSWCRR